MAWDSPPALALSAANIRISYDSNDDNDGIAIGCNVEDNDADSDEKES